MLNETGKVRCVECRLFNLQHRASMAAEGFGQCAMDKGKRPGRFEHAAFPRLCPDYARALDSIVEHRILWLFNQKPGARSYRTPLPAPGGKKEAC